MDVNPANYADYVWIPHRPVVKYTDQCTTKIRPVLNCSLKTGGSPSLNEAAFKGPNLMTGLLNLALSFRTNSYSLISDIKQAFLMIHLKDEVDRNRFCIFMKDSNGRLVAYRYKTIVFGFTSSPFCLNYILKHHASSYPNDEIVKLLCNNLYVDNFLVTSNDPSFLKQVYYKSMERLREGGFELRSWCSNESSLSTTFEAEGTNATHGKLSEKVLGYEYFPSSDFFSLSKVDLNSVAKTKREVLSENSKVYDPLGIFQPITVRGRILLRELWMKKFDWDQPIPDECVESWRKLALDLVQLPSLSFDRNAVDSTDNALVMFCDASKLAYGFAAYAVGENKSNLIFSKNKVSPMKTRTLPTLELLSAFLALSCLFTIMTSYTVGTFTSVIVAVDAQIVLSWILSRNVKTKNVFTANRVKDIVSMVDEFKDKFGIDIVFKYVKSEHNPADMITRGLNFEQFTAKYDFWLSGPSWLSQSPLVWPENTLGCLSEESKSSPMTNINRVPEIVSNTVTSTETNCHDCLIDFTRFSSWNKLLNSVARTFMVIKILRKLPNSFDCFSKAREYIIKSIQSKAFSVEIDFLESVRPSRNIPPLVTQLDMFIDESGILRSRGRIARSLYYDNSVLYPIILPPDSPVTNLLVTHFHQMCKHLGIQTTVNLIRTSGFWIPRARQVVKKVLSSCMTCQKYNAFSYRYPKFTNMSKSQMNLVRPFLHTGVDYTGALHVFDGGKERKYYILLYTCMSIRAVHLDLLPDMSTDSFIMSFVRFTNLYGVPSHLYSDNALSFEAGGRILSKSLLSDQFTQYLVNSNIKHIRIPVHSPWTGSLWERMIKVVKSCLFKTVGRSKLQYFQLITILSDIQNSINSRPLTYRSSNNDLDVISPNSFLKLCSNSTLIFNRDDGHDLWLPPSEQRKVLIHSLDTFFN